MGKKPKYGGDRVLAKSFPKGWQAGCLFYHLVWSRRCIRTNRLLRVKARILLNFEVYASPSDVTSIPGRHLKWSVFSYILFERLSVVGFLVDNWDIFAFEVYRPAFRTWRETMTGNVLLWSPSKGFVTSLNNQVSIKFIAKHKIKVYKISPP